MFFNFSFSKPMVKTEYVFYDIYPTNKHELEKSMDDNSPLINDEMIRHGTVNWKINYRYKRERKRGVCSITEVKTLVKIKYILPKIPKDFKAPNGVKSAFNRYYQILIGFLDEYKGFAKDAASELETKLVKINPRNSDCDEIKKDAKVLASSIINKYKKKNKDYEINTYEGFFDSIKEEKL